MRTYSSATSERIHVPETNDPILPLSEPAAQPDLAEAKLHVDGVAMVRLLVRAVCKGKPLCGFTNHYLLL